MENKKQENYIKLCKDVMDFISINVYNLKNDNNPPNPELYDINKSLLDIAEMFSSKHEYSELKKRLENINKIY